MMRDMTIVFINNQDVEKLIPSHKAFLFLFSCVLFTKCQGEFKGYMVYTSDFTLWIFQK